MSLLLPSVINTKLK